MFSRTNTLVQKLRHQLKWSNVTRLIERSNSSAAPFKWSYACGPADQPLVGLTMGQIFDRGAEKYGEMEAVVSKHQGVRKTFVQVKEESEILAAAFVSLNLKRGDRLGIWGPNSYEWYLTQAAAGKAGLILVNINPSYRPDELKFCLKKVAVNGIVCADKFKTSNYYEMLKQIVPEICTSKPGDLCSPEFPDLKTVISMSQEPLSGTFRFDDLSTFGGSDARKEVERLSTAIQFDEPCNIQFTSGTTGLPKGAVLTHHNLVNNAKNVGKRCGYDKKPMRICLPVPLYHCFGCVGGTICGILYGARVVLPSEGFDPVAIGEAIEEESINSLYGTPTMFVDVLNRYNSAPFDVSHLSTGIMAGAPCPEELVRQLMTKLNMKDILVMYGMTETSPVTLQCFPTDSVSVRSQTVGYPSDHTEVKIVDENGNIVPVNSSGELLIRGYCNFLEYWDDKKKSEETFTKDRWFKTGDISSMDENGYCKIVGRIKDMIIRGGENIYPAEIENFYMSHPHITEAQVFGVPDSRLGEEVAMWIKVKNVNEIPEIELTVEDLKLWSKGKIAHYKIPKYISVKDDFPTTVTGKIQKFVMKDLTVKELNLS